MSDKCEALPPGEHTVTSSGMPYTGLSFKQGVANVAQKIFNPRFFSGMAWHPMTR